MGVLLVVKNRYNNVVTFLDVTDPENEFLIPDRVRSVSGDSRLGLVLPNVKVGEGLFNRQILRLQDVDVEPHSRSQKARLEKKKMKKKKLKAIKEGKRETWERKRVTRKEMIGMMGRFRDYTHSA